MSPSPLTPAIERARVLIASGDLGSAQVLLERAVELGRENLGKDEPDVLTAQRELAGVFLLSDDPMGARRMLEDAYAAGQWRLGDSDPIMLHISHDLGVVAQELGNRHEARKAFGRVATSGPSALGEGHQFVARARAYLGEDPSGAVVRPEAPPTQPAVTQPTVTRPTNVTPPRPNENQPSVAQPSVAQPSVPRPSESQSSMTQPTVAQPTVQRDRGGEAHIRAVLEGPTNVLPVTRPAPQSEPVSRPETKFVPQPEPQRQGNPWDTAPVVPEQRQPTVNEWNSGPHHRPAPQPAPAQDGGYRTAQTGYQSSHQGGYRSVDNPQPVHQHGYPRTHNATAETATTPHQDPGTGQPYRKSGLAVGLTVVATLVALVAVGALVVVLVDREKDQPTPPVATASAGAPQLGGAPPTAVKLADRGSAVDVSWADPSGGKAPFMITMAREGQQFKPVSQVGLGKRETTVAGLNPKLEYCFAVVAVYSSSKYASSNQVCTERG
ncbi:tetratricopeptide repeat protein [Actinoplanes subglobosus]|uniref:Tetratricopeptide repeat protein n=1 Tax=Actinoplanes subglobosus TaxID=1547892 RepID=A0ABV8J201_9ACTN